jgi:predicted alpha/beta superfamily hydrolase
VSGARAPFSISLAEAAFDRLEDLESLALQDGVSEWRLSVGLPKGYAKARRQRYPLVLMINAASLFGAAVEMSRLLAVSREVRPCIVIDAAGPPPADAAALRRLVELCVQRYRIEADQVAALVHDDAALLELCHTESSGIARCIVGTDAPIETICAALAGRKAGGANPAWAWTVRSIPNGSAARHAAVSWKLVPESTVQGLAVPAFIHGLRTFWDRGHAYADEVVPLAHPLVCGSLSVLRPLLKVLNRSAGGATPADGRHVMRSNALGRNFEIFVSLPAGADQPGRRYPALFALDANAGFATVADLVARLAAAGEIQDTVVVGVGTPRSEGEREFAYRRFEEFSPPASADYRFDDELGRFFRSAFALRGQEAKDRLRKAPGLFRFLAAELIPTLLAQLPIDPARLSLLGHSAAGTFVGYALSREDSPFASYLCLSPGVGMSGGWLLREARSPARQAERLLRVFAALGSEELGNRFNCMAGIPQTQLYAQLLREQGRAQVEFHQLDGETHITLYPRALAQALTSLLAPPMSKGGGLTH